MPEKMSDLQQHLKLEPIRRHAEAYGMNTALPKTQAEFVAKLYAFGFALNGSMEEMLNRMLILQDNLLKVSALPVTYTPKKNTEVSSGD